MNQQYERLFLELKLLITEESVQRYIDSDLKGRAEKIIKENYVLLVP